MIRNGINSSINNKSEKNKSQEINKIRSKKYMAKKSMLKYKLERDSNPNIYSKKSISKTSKSVNKSTYYDKKS